MEEVIVRCEDALRSKSPGLDARAAVRDGWLALGSVGLDEASAQLRAIEFEADRIEIYGTDGLKAQLAHARAVLQIT